jgi:proline racemase
MIDLAGAYSVVDSHTAGHPTRVILSGIPALRGMSLRERRDHFRSHFDALRPALLHEPRGHAAMVGCILQPSTVADYGAFFISSYVYLDMCGHATIGLAKTLDSTGALAADCMGFTLETPAGLVTVHLERDNAGKLTGVRFTNVECRVLRERIGAIVPELGSVTADIVYGGCAYAIVDAAALKLDLSPDSVSACLRAGSAIKRALNDRLESASDTVRVDSVLFVRETAPHAARHLVVLESNKFDRSPCGTGTSARLAQLHHLGRIQPGEPYSASNLFDVSFIAHIIETTKEGVIPEVTGMAHVTAFSTLVAERGDPLTGGFLCR